MGTFKTADTALAAWLIIKGIRLEKIDTEGFPATFAFERSNGDLQELTDAFNFGIAEGNILQFFRAYKYLLSEIKP